MAKKQSSTDPQSVKPKTLTEKIAAREALRKSENEARAEARAIKAKVPRRETARERRATEKRLAKIEAKKRKAILHEAREVAQGRGKAWAEAKIAEVTDPARNPLHFSHGPRIKSKGELRGEEISKFWTKKRAEKEARLAAVLGDDSGGFID
jgi:hypothetical protein